MNKSLIIIALVAAFIGLVAANKFGGHGHRYVRPHRYHQGEYGHGGFGHRGDDLEFDEELDLDLHEGQHLGVNHGRGPYSDHDGFYHGGEGLGGHGFRRGGHVTGGFGHGGRNSGFGKHRRHQGFRPIRRHGGLGGVGAIGGIRGSEGSFGGVGSHNHLGGSKFAKGHDNTLLAGSNRFDLDHDDTDLHENEGLHKHQVINNDKTFVNSKTTGVNDVDGFRNVDGHSNRNHLGSAQSGLAAHSAGGSIGSKFDADRDFGAVGGQNAELEAGGAVGGIL